MTATDPRVGERGPASDRLTIALVALATDGRRPPCGQYGISQWWLSDDPRRRAMAARRCTGCPVLDACDAAADEAGERFGVWAGRDRGSPGQDVRPAGHGATDGTQP